MDRLLMEQMCIRDRLPICPTSYGDSPYQSFSAYAGNPYFIELEMLESVGYLEAEDYKTVDWESAPDHVNYGALYQKRYPILRKAVRRFQAVSYTHLMGHAVYTLSDPREVILKSYAKRLSEEKGLQKEYELYERVERLAGEAIARKRHLFKPICANVDFYSGFVYSMLGIPEELYTPIFAISRISGWSAHRLEEVVNNGKIIRPAYKYVGYHRPYCALAERHE